ncbi:hypothetical protein NC652_029131 [Populus alba x Populus x berolinensis]|nr:hypothetical protein NC652_029131 [Populus alba x Populus x berolinensis]
MRAVFLVAIQRGMSSLFAFRCFPICLCATFAVGGVTSGVDLDGCVGFCDRLSLSELSLFVFFYFFPILAAGSFHRLRLCRGLVVMLREMRIARGDGLRWRSVGFGFVEYRGIILLLQGKNSNRDLEEGRDRRRLKLSSLTENIANKICGCCCTGASIPFLSEIHVDRLYNQTQNALFSFSITAKIKFCFVSVYFPSQEIKKYYCPSKMQENSSSFKSSLCSLTNYGDSFTSNLIAIEIAK